MLDVPTRQVMQGRNLLMAEPGTPVRTAARLMADRSVGAVMVVDDQRLVGILTERDVVFRVVARGLDPDATAISDVMTAQPHAIHPDEPFGHALAVMHDKGFRHLPVVEDGKPIGIVSARNALDPDLEEYAVETERRLRYVRDQ